MRINLQEETMKEKILELENRIKHLEAEEKVRKLVLVQTFLAIGLHDNEILNDILVNLDEAVRDENSGYDYNLLKDWFDEVHSVQTGVLVCSLRESSSQQK